MLEELPPIVALPSSPADSLRPVPLFVRCAGLYDMRLSYYNHSKNASIKDTDSSHMVETSSILTKPDVTKPQLSNTQDEQAVQLLGLQYAPEKEYDGVQPSVVTNEQNMDALTEKEVDVLLEVLEARYRKYVAEKQQTTERYLTRIEADVDYFLTTYRDCSFSGFGSGVASFIKNTFVSKFPSPQRERRNENKKERQIVPPTNGECNENGLPDLKDSSYRANSIPFNYLDVRPPNIEAIAANLVVIRYCLAEFSTPGSTVRKLLLGPIVRGVWDQSLTPLKNSATELLSAAQQNVWPPLEYFLRRQWQVDAAQWTERSARYNRVVKALREDLNYLHTIREMDEGAIRGSVQLRPSIEKEEGILDCVPVSGLALSRLHRLENEHRTVWEFWRSRMQRLIGNRRRWNLIDIRQRPPTLSRLRGILQLAQQPGSIAEHRRGRHFDSSAHVALYSRPGRVGRLSDPDAKWHCRNKREKQKFNVSTFRRHHGDS